MSDNSQNNYRPYTVTTVDGFINAFNEHGDNYFAEVSYVTGTLEGDKKRLQYVNLLVSKKLGNLAKKVIAGIASLEDVCVTMEIHNLYFYQSDETDQHGKPFLNSKGILASITV